MGRRIRRQEHTQLKTSRLVRVIQLRRIVEVYLAVNLGMLEVNIDDFESAIGKTLVVHVHTYSNAD